MSTPHGHCEPRTRPGRSRRGTTIRIAAGILGAALSLTACNPPVTPAAERTTSTTVKSGPAGATTTPAAPTAGPGGSTVTSPGTIPTPSPGSAGSSTPAHPVVPPPRGHGTCAGFPSPTCTGVPAGTTLTTHRGDLVVSTTGQVVDGVHVTGALFVRAPNVVIRNSQIDGIVNNTFADDPYYSFRISDSTIGSSTRCDSTASALGEGSFTAERVLIRGNGDGIRASAPNITVRDSYIKLCTTSADAHSDGIQDYTKTANLVFDHNTVDQCGGRIPTDGNCDLSFGYTAPIFVNSTIDGGTRGAQITNNLVMGGVYSIYIHPQPGAPWVITGNRIVAGTWDYAPAETSGQCKFVQQWSNNATVTINSSYTVTSTVSAVPCPN